MAPSDDEAVSGGHRKAIVNPTSKLVSFNDTFGREGAKKTGHVVSTKEVWQLCQSISLCRYFLAHLGGKSLCRLSLQRRPEFASSIRQASGERIRPSPDERDRANHPCRGRRQKIANFCRLPDPSPKRYFGWIRSINSAADFSCSTMISFIMLRVAPTNSLRTALSSSTSKSISVKMIAGAAWPLKR